MTWTTHRNCSKFGGPGEDGGTLALSSKVLGHKLTAKQANAQGILYFAACPAWVNGGKLRRNPDGTQVFPNIHTPPSLANLQPGAKVTFRYKGRTAVGVFLDVGPASWTNRYLDLGYPLARALGFSGTGDVDWMIGIPSPPKPEEHHWGWFIAPDGPKAWAMTAAAWLNGCKPASGQMPGGKVAWATQGRFSAIVRLGKLHAALYPPKTGIKWRTRLAEGSHETLVQFVGRVKAGRVG